MPAIVDAVGGRMTILVDGGIRTGMDVFKALALGADAVLIGRPFVTMVYGAGAEGVKTYVEKLKAELADTMAMCGAHSLAVEGDHPAQQRVIHVPHPGSADPAASPASGR